MIELGSISALELIRALKGKGVVNCPYCGKRLIDKGTWTKAFTEGAKSKFLDSYSTSDSNYNSSVEEWRDEWDDYVPPLPDKGSQSPNLNKRSFWEYVGLNSSIIFLPNQKTKNPTKYKNRVNKQANPIDAQSAYCNNCGKRLEIFIKKDFEICKHKSEV
jgi:DNA-directed RNA polymerase subunit RPC12/RpoP